MAHLHSVYDTDAHFKIDGVTRSVKNASQTKTMLIQHDHNSERFTFELPRMIDGHDMSQCNVVEIHYINIDSANKTNQYAGVYEVDDFDVSPDSDDVVICSWLISSNATQYVGNLSFVLRFVCSTNGKVDYVWNTVVHSGVFVSKGICNGDMVAEEYADILEKWRHELTSGEVTDERIAEVFEAYMKENPIELPDLSVYVKSVNNSKPDKNGNVTVKIPDPITDYVKTVNGVKPVNGNVTVEIPKTGVQTVNGKKPDSNGNVEIEVSGGNVDQSQIEQAVANYLTQNPVTGGMTKTEKNLILQLFRNAAYTSAGMNPAFTQLETLWNGSGEGGGDVHSHSYTSSITTAATCTTAGVRTYTCSCGHSYTESIPATGHNYVNGTCTVCGAADPTYTPGVTLTSISAVYNGGEVPIGTAVSDLKGIAVTAHYSNGTSATVVGYTLSGTIAEGNNTITVAYEGQTATFVVVGANVLTSISASYSSGSVTVGTALSDLTGVVVTAHYSDGTSTTVTAYTMTGTIGEGSNTITVSYGGKTTTFTVTGTAESGGGGETVEMMDIVTDFTWTDGIWLNAGGAETANSIWSASPFIPFAAGEVVTCTDWKTNNLKACIVCYDADKNFLSSSETAYSVVGVDQYLTAVENTAYIRSTINTPYLPHAAGDGKAFCKMLITAREV